MKSRPDVLQFFALSAQKCRYGLRQWAIWRKFGTLRSYLFIVHTTWSVAFTPLFDNFINLSSFSIRNELLSKSHLEFDAIKCIRMSLHETKNWLNLQSELI